MKILAKTFLLLLLISSSTLIAQETLQQVTDNGNSTSTLINLTNSNGLRVVNSNMPSSSFNAIHMGQHGSNTQFMRFIPKSTGTGDFDWGHDFYYDFTNTHWGVDGGFDIEGTLDLAGRINILNSHETLAGYFLSDDENSKYIFTYFNTGGAELEFQHDGDVILGQAGNVGIGVTSPETNLHIAGGDFGIKSQYATTMIEAFDAHLDITSSSDATWGSSINLIEGNGSSNTDIWSIVRQTTNGSGNSSLRFNFGTNNNHINSNKVTFNSNGDVGIGKTNPLTKLHLLQSNEKGLRLERSGHDSYEFRLAGSRGLNIFNSTQGNYEMVFDGNGNVGIGTVTPQSKLAVDGQIRATEVKVLANVNDVPDYVFESDYKLRTLQETKQYISENKHLPEIPSAAEIGENGIDLGDMNMRLLKKIEELTLYQIELMEEMQEMKKELKALKD